MLSNEIKRVLTEAKKKKRNYGYLKLFVAAFAYILPNTFYFYLRRVIRSISRVVPSRQNCWVMGEGYFGRERVGENGKYLFLQIAEKNDVEAIWLSNSSDEVTCLRDNGYTAYKAYSFKGFVSQLRADTLFCTNGTEFNWCLTGSAEIVQLWHGVPLKKVGWDHLDETYSRSRIREYRERIYNFDSIVTTSKNPPADIVRRMFRMPEEDTLVTGYPRTDYLLSNEFNTNFGVDSETLSKLKGIEKGSTVFMYAPTFRRRFLKENRSFITDTGLDFEALNQLLDDCDGYLVLKLHHKTHIPPEVERQERILIADPLSDPYPLLKTADALVTDYSSIFIDFLVLDKPVLFFPYDLEQYESEEGLYYKYESVTPGSISATPVELYESIRQVARGNDQFEVERRTIRDLFYDRIDDQSAERIYTAVKKNR